MPELLPAIEPGAAPIVEVIDRWVDPLQMLAAARRVSHPVLLFSGLPGHPSSRYSILAAEPLLTLSIKGDRLTVVTDPGGRNAATSGPIDDPFEALRRFAPVEAQCRRAGLPFVGGAIGYFGYGLRRALESLPPTAADPLAHDDAWFGLYDAAVLFDHLERRVVLVATPCRAGPEDAGRRARRRLAALREMLEEPGQAAAPAGRVDAQPMGRVKASAMTTRHDYLSQVGQLLKLVAAGEIYQANLSQRIACRFAGDPVALFRELAERNPAPFSAFLDTGRLYVVSASPERFVSLRGDRVRSVPIKGTRPRGRSEQDDRRLADELRGSGKDRAENVMITDLVRNDLGRVCETGSVEVEALCRLESFATVHHLVSEVAGRLRADRDRIDLVRALFPGGSMTGAPKIRAMQVIDELEREERGIYAGSIGYLSFDGGLDLSIVIRTIVCQDGMAHFRVGGGIVAESEPDAEYRESLDKGMALLDVLRADLRNRSEN